MGEIEKHKIKIIKNQIGMPEKVFIDEKRLRGIGKVELKYTYSEDKNVQEVVISITCFESLEIITQDV